MGNRVKINNYDDYLIDDEGYVISLKYSEPRVLKTRKHRNGYKYVNLCKDGKYKSERIHKLVAKHFLNDYDDKLQVNHIDGNKENNNVSNLEIVNQSINIKHAIKNGLIKVLHGEEKPQAKLTEKEVIEIRDKYKNKCYTRKDLSEMYGVSLSTIKFITLNKTWKHLL